MGSGGRRLLLKNYDNTPETKFRPFLLKEELFLWSSYVYQYLSILAGSLVLCPFIPLCHCGSSWRMLPPRIPPPLNPKAGGLSCSQYSLVEAIRTLFLREKQIVPFSVEDISLVLFSVLSRLQRQNNLPILKFSPDSKLQMATKRKYRGQDESWKRQTLDEPGRDSSSSNESLTDRLNRIDEFANENSISMFTVAKSEESYDETTTSAPLVQHAPPVRNRRIRVSLDSAALKIKIQNAFQNPINTIRQTSSKMVLHDFDLPSTSNELPATPFNTFSSERLNVPNPKEDDIEIQELQKFDYPTHMISKNHHRSKAVCVLEKLQATFFASRKWTDAERISMITLGKPKISLKHFETWKTMNDFKLPSDYLQKVPWLTGCKKLSRLFCWPCLLIGGDGEWATGYTPSIMILRDAIEHSSSEKHLENVKTVKTLTYHYRGKKQTVKIAEKRPTPLDLNSLTEDELIGELADRSFLRGSWSENEKEAIIRTCKSTTVIPDLKQVQFENDRMYIRSMSAEFYRRVTWMRGSAERGKLYCWPCLLFHHDGVWGKSGFDDTVNLDSAVTAHEADLTHMKACISLKARQTKLKKPAKCVALNLDSKSDRELFTRLTDVVCYLKTKSHSHAQADYLNLLKLMSRKDPKINALLVGRENLVNNLGERISNAIETYLRQQFAEELARAQFVSLILEKVSNIENSCLIAIIVRYVTAEGVIREKFVTYVEANLKSPVSELLDKVKAQFSHLSCESKLVGFTYDGSVVKIADTAEFNIEFKNTYKAANFFHYKDHDLLKIIEQVLSQFAHVRDFFKFIYKINDFLVRHSDSQSLRNLGLGKLSVKSNTSIEFVPILAQSYNAVVRFFKSAAANCSENWNNEDVVEAKNLANFLGRAKSKFMVALLYEVFPAAKKLSQDFGAKRKFHKRYASTMKYASELTAIKDKGWMRILSSALQLKGAQEFPLEDSADETLAVSFEQIIDTMYQLVLLRNYDLETFAYYGLVCDDYLAKKGNFEEKCAPIKEFWHDFDSDRLYAQMTFCAENSNTFGEKAVDIFNNIVSRNLATVLPEYYNFLKLVFTLPMLGFDNVSAISRLKACVGKGKKFDAGETFLRMERDSLIVEKRDGAFYADVFEIFSKQQANCDPKDI